jgi:hypothetical protein
LALHAHSRPIRGNRPAANGHLFGSPSGHVLLLLRLLFQAALIPLDDVYFAGLCACGSRRRLRRRRHRPGARLIQVQYLLRGGRLLRGGEVADNDLPATLRRVFPTLLHAAVGDLLLVSACRQSIAGKPRRVELVSPREAQRRAGRDRR